MQSPLLKTFLVQDSQFPEMNQQNNKEFNFPKKLQALKVENSLKLCRVLSTK